VWSTFLLGFLFAPNPNPNPDCTLQANEAQQLLNLRPNDRDAHLPIRRPISTEICQDGV
jgi:hypothetical protein